MQVFKLPHFSTPYAGRREAVNNCVVLWYSAIITLLRTGQAFLKFLTCFLSQKIQRNKLVHAECMYP